MTELSEIKVPAVNPEEQARQERMRLALLDWKVINEEVKSMLPGGQAFIVQARISNNTVFSLHSDSTTVDNKPGTVWTQAAVLKLDPKTGKLSGSTAFYDNLKPVGLLTDMLQTVVNLQQRVRGGEKLKNVIKELREPRIY